MDPRLDLEKVIRPKLARMEDSLIFDLFERAKYKTNDIVYEADGIPIQNTECLNVSDYFGFLTPSDLRFSFLDFLLRKTEEIHSLAGRFQSPEEFAFFDNLPKPVVKRKSNVSPVKSIGLNFNPQIKKEYLGAIGYFCEQGDDGNYGSTAVCDVRCLHALSKRIHFGTYVAESKFQAEPEVYSALVLLKDRRRIEEKLTNLKVEEAILNRLREKGARYGVNADFIANFYRDEVIPLTKQVEIEYLIRRGL